MPIDPYRLALSVTHADGRVTRWGGDELNSKDVHTGLSFSTSIPGGFKDMTCSLLRRLDIDYADEALFDDVRVLGPGNESVWGGRMAQFPRQQADQFSVNPGAIGWSAHLLDDPSFREIYADRDLSKWGAPSVTRQNTNFSFPLVNSGSVIQDAVTGSPILDHTQTRLANTAGANRVLSESVYDSGGIPLGALYYEVTTIDNATSATPLGGNWQVFADLSTVDTANGDLSANLQAGGSGFVTATFSTRVFAILNAYFNGTSAGDGNFRIQWRNLTVYGAHGLTRVTGNPSGFLASDMIANIVSRTAPLLTYTTGAGGSIATSAFGIPHIVFYEPTTASDAITLINGYHLWEWGVYDDREFFWRPPDPNRLTWEARLSDGAQVSLEGDDANNIFNGVFVTFTDPSGRTSTVGPPGSVADATDASLVDNSIANPVNAHGIPRRWGRLDVTNTTTRAGAIQLGAIWLAEHNLPARRGQLTLTGLVQHPTQGKRPVWAVRAGDYIRIADRPGDPVRRIIETSYDHDSRKLTASLDQTVFKLEAIMERMGVNLVGVI